MCVYDHIVFVLNKCVIYGKRREMQRRGADSRSHYAVRKGGRDPKPRSRAWDKPRVRKSRVQV